METDNGKGLILAVASSVFIGSSFILKKKGLKRAAANGTRAGYGGYTYLLEPLWWAGMITMIVGEAANFVAYIYAPAVLVTPLGALSIIISAILAHFLLKEKLKKMGVLGCVSCIVGSVVIVIHAPKEQTPNSVQEIWSLATQPVYVAITMSIVLALILHFEPLCGQSNVLVYIGICSLMGALTVMSIKAIGIAIKLTMEGVSQIGYPQTWLFLLVAVTCVVTQLIYLNKALDTFNAAIVSPVYYVMFTTLTIVASAIMFKDWSGQDAASVASELCGFITVLTGTMILHGTREEEQQQASSSGNADLIFGSSESVRWYESRKSPNEEHLISLYSPEY
ncbi:probable magnesium transporter NIPA6 isoform X3 [Raphanus sativus]|uniref:Probable magnesium transporter n=1 Tax=Raphanus sativus TaxID=3726 RepID=A0A6J0JCJ3_RAPSA|nr:probable magnesium transporter NIPA6 isoform X3 [Raphanus sativus]